MHRRCVSLGSLAAVVAALCVLGPASVAGASGDLSSGLLLDRPRCCEPPGLPAGGSQGVEIPVAGLLPDGRAPAGGAAAVKGPAFAQTGEPSGEEPREQPAQDEPATTELPQDDAKIPVTVPEEAAESFEGSPKPAGPDLTPSEERDLISRGWQ